MTPEKQAVPATDRRAYYQSELPDHLLAAIRSARMDKEHDHLNALLEDAPDAE